MIWGFSAVDILIVMVGISLLPLFIDTLNTFIPVGRMVHKYSSVLLVSVLMGLYMASIYYFFTAIIPFYSDSSEIMDLTLFREKWEVYDWTYSVQWSTWSNEHKIMVLGGMVFTVWLWCNTIYSYMFTVLHSASRDRIPVQTTSDPSGELKHCDICKIMKAKGTHHCSQCGKCIPNMDHHCPFTSNCVSTGENGNFTYFFMFIAYTAAGSALWASTTFLPFYRCYYELELSQRCMAAGPISFIFIPGVLVFFATAGFVLLHVILIVFGKSTLEFLYWLNSKKSAESRENINLENEKQNLDRLTKLHCTIPQFLFPYLFKRRTEKKKKS